MEGILERFLQDLDLILHRDSILPEFLHVVIEDLYEILGELALVIGVFEFLLGVFEYHLHIFNMLLKEHGLFSVGGKILLILESF